MSIPSSSRAPRAVVTSPEPDWLTVVSRPFPSCVLVVIAGPRPIVVDPGSLTDGDRLPELLAGARVALDEVATVVCTHHHSDHVGAVGVRRRLSPGPRIWHSFCSAAPAIRSRSPGGGA
jgi:glyoxylase-like metal-dependent hydrolase (beta-lactamase superfamily II)